MPVDLYDPMGWSEIGKTPPVPRGMTLEEALVEATNEWYSTWHRFAAQDEQPPIWMKVILTRLVRNGMLASLHVEGRLLHVYEECE